MSAYQKSIMLLLGKCLFFVSATHDAITTNSRLAQRWSSCLTNKRLKVQVLHRLPNFLESGCSSVKQERVLWVREVEGSNPSSPKTFPIADCRLPIEKVFNRSDVGKSKIENREFLYGVVAQLELEHSSSKRICASSSLANPSNF